jgi:nicotinamide riboside kinase
MAQNSIKKIAILGAESTGKTWLCEALAAHYSTNWVPEYAREYFNDSDIYNYTLNDLIIISKKQLALENELVTSANTLLFCDTNLITLKIWAELEFQQTPEFIETQLITTKYDYYFITDNLLPWESDAQRQNKFSRDVILQMNIAEVEKQNVPFSIITGLHHQRLINAIQILESTVI